MIESVAMLTRLEFGEVAQQPVPQSGN